MRLLTADQMTDLTTERLLAYKKRLLSVPDGPDWDATASDGTMHKARPEWVTCYETCKDILSRRENVTKLKKMAGRVK